MASSKQMFEDTTAKKKYVEIYYSLGEDKFYQDLFCDLIRKTSEEKLESLDDLETFYLTVDDVYEVHERVMQDKDRRDVKDK